MKVASKLLLGCTKEVVKSKEGIRDVPINDLISDLFLWVNMG